MLFRKCDCCDGDGVHVPADVGSMKCPVCDGVGFVEHKPAESVEALALSITDKAVTLTKSMFRVDADMWDEEFVNPIKDYAAAQIAAFIEAQKPEVAGGVPLAHYSEVVDLLGVEKATNKRLREALEKIRERENDPESENSSFGRGWNDGVRLCVEIAQTALEKL